MRKYLVLFILLFGADLFIQCTPVKRVTAYVTTADGSMQFASETVRLSKVSGEPASVVRYDKSELAPHQVDGFGLAVTTSSCYNLLKMSPQDRKAFLDETFSREKGAGMSLIRVAMLPISALMTIIPGVTRKELKIFQSIRRIGTIFSRSSRRYMQSILM